MEKPVDAGKLSPPALNRAEVAANLLKRLDAYRKRHDMTDSQVGQRALKDTKFIPGVRAGNDFNIRTVEKLNKWMDKNPDG